MESVYRIPTDLVDYEGVMAELTAKDKYGSEFILPIKDTNICILGEPGSGKTVLMNRLLKQTTRKCDSLHIIFDTKGDYLKRFYTDGDMVLSLRDEPNVPQYANARWSIMKEIGESCMKPDDVALEIAKSVFSEEIRTSSSPFFPRTACTVFAGLLSIAYSKYYPRPSNKVLISRILNMSPKDMRTEFNKFEEYKGLSSLISETASKTTADIISELQLVLRDVFVGNALCDGPGFSVQEFVRGNGKKLFVRYNIDSSSASLPFFKLVLDLAAKEALANSDGNKRIYIYLDEFVMLPPLENIDNLCNFGRSMGVRVISAAQNVSAVHDKYQKDRGNAILSGHVSMISFAVSDVSTREYLHTRAGKTFGKQSIFGVARNDIRTEIREMPILPDEALNDLRTGEAIVLIRGKTPFYTSFR